MPHTEFANVSHDVYRQYGEAHGCAIFYSQEETDNFLDFMQAQLGSGFEYYMKGFASGVNGEVLEKYRYMKGLEPNEKETETADY